MNTATPVSYRIEHKNNRNDTRNDFYPITYKRGIDEKILRLQNDSEDFTVNSVLNEFPIFSIQQASYCFRMGRFINQFRPIRGFEAPSSASVNTSNTDFSSINSLSSADDDEANPNNHYDSSHQIDTDSEDDNIVCDISIQADKPRLWQPKEGHEILRRKTDASLVKKLIRTSDAPPLDTKALIQKLDEVAKAVDLGVSTRTNYGPITRYCTFLDSHKHSSRY